LKKLSEEEIIENPSQHYTQPKQWVDFNGILRNRKIKKKRCEIGNITSTFI